MSAKPKLTKIQYWLLIDVSESSRYVADYYPPAKALVAKGLCQWIGSHLHITGAGKEFLKEAGK